MRENLTTQVRGLLVMIWMLRTESRSLNHLRPPTTKYQSYMQKISKKTCSTLLKAYFREVESLPSSRRSQAHCDLSSHRARNTAGEAFARKECTITMSCFLMSLIRPTKIFHYAVVQLPRRWGRAWHAGLLGYWHYVEHTRRTRCMCVSNRPRFALLAQHAAPRLCNFSHEAEHQLILL